MELSSSTTSELAVVRVATPLPAEPKGRGAGHGLVGMRERVDALGGRLAVGPSGNEFVVEAILPRGIA